MNHTAGKTTGEGGLRSPVHFPEVGVVSLVPNRWGGPWMSRNQILSRLSRYFHVVWCDPAITLRQLGIFSLLRNPNVDYRTTPSGLIVYRPEGWLPTIGRPRFLAHWTMRQRLLRARQILLNLGCRKIILYLWRPDHQPALDLIDYDLGCYHIVDEYSFSVIEKPIERREAKLISSVDQVFIHSAALFERKGKFNPQTLLVPNGVDYPAFATPSSEPSDLSSVPHPRIGYVGFIKTQLDFALLVTLAQSHPQWSFVLVGPKGNLGKDAALVKRLSELPNVYFLGPKPVSALPGYVQHLDVCMLCYKLNDYTKYIYPLKLHEYLASGRPVVGSPIPSVQEFADVVKIARTPNEWSQDLQASLTCLANSDVEIESRRIVARRHDWTRLVDVIARTLCDRLGPSYLERFKSISLSA